MLYFGGVDDLYVKFYVGGNLCVRVISMGEFTCTVFCGGE